MAGVTKKSFGAADEARAPAKTRMEVVDLATGDAHVIEPGHDAWITSQEPFVGYEFDSSTAGSYATPR